MLENLKNLWKDCHAPCSTRAKWDYLSLSLSRSLSFHEVMYGLNYNWWNMLFNELITKSFKVTMISLMLLAWWTWSLNNQQSPIHLMKTSLKSIARKRIVKYDERKNIVSKCDTQIPKLVSSKVFIISHSHRNVCELSRMETIFRMARNGMGSNMYQCVRFLSSKKNMVL